MNELRTWQAGIAVFLKLNPEFFQRQPQAARWQAAKYLREHFQSVHVFFGLGYSELLVLAGDENLPELLATVTQLRQSSVDEDGNGDPLFVRTTTYPLVSVDRIHRPKKYEELKGTIHPTVTIICTPAYEDAILDSLPTGRFLVRNLYGDSDLILYWPSENGIGFGEFAAWLAEFREQWSTTDAVVRTTSYLEGKRSQSDRTPRRHPAVRVTEQLYPQLFAKLEKLRPLALRASVTDLLLRLAACVQDRTITADYRDMLKTFPYVESVVNVIISEKPLDLEVVKARLTLTEIADLGRAAINQRYAGLETHPETLAHSQAPLLCDIRSLILAASSLPHHIFGRLRSNGQTLWAGYVLFGSTYWPLLHEQNILALPAASTFRPIEEWWKMTHEVAHAIYRIFKVKRKIDDPAIFEGLEEAYGKSAVNVERVIGEIFANWFDWKYIFRRDTSFFLEHVWRSWLTFPLVWERKRQYLVRSFAVFLAGSLQELEQSLTAGRYADHAEPYLRKEWEKFQQILRRVPRGDEYFSQVKASMLEHVFREILTIALLIEFFETKFETACDVQGLEGRLNPPYENVDAHVDQLWSGAIVSDGIVNPCELHLRLLKRLSGNPPPLEAEIAYVLSLEHRHIKMRSSAMQL
jgi:hypothetical protein